MLRENPQHLCYKVSPVIMTEVIDIPSAIEILSIVGEIGKGTFNW